MDRPRPSTPHTRLRAVALLALALVLAACGVPERGPATASSWSQLCRRAGQSKTSDHLACDLTILRAARVERTGAVGGRGGEESVRRPS
jgi:hypothetical protein